MEIFFLTSFEHQRKIRSLITCSDKTRVSKNLEITFRNIFSNKFRTSTATKIERLLKHWIRSIWILKTQAVIKKPKRKSAQFLDGFGLDAIELLEQNCEFYWKRPRLLHGYVPLRWSQPLQNLKNSNHYRTYKSYYLSSFYNLECIP